MCRSISASSRPVWPLIAPAWPRRYPGPHAARAAAGGLVLDICAVLAFVAIGRHTHHDGDAMAGLWHTAWPFLAGLALGLAAVGRGGAAGPGAEPDWGPGSARPGRAW